MFSTIEDLTGQLKPLSVYVKLLQRKIINFVDNDGVFSKFEVRFTFKLQ